MIMQLELIPQNKHERMWPLWRKDLWDSVRDAWDFRHWPHTTGWSMAVQSYRSAQWLFQDGQMHRAELKRWWKFHRRLNAWGKKRGGSHYTWRLIQPEDTK